MAYADRNIVIHPESFTAWDGLMASWLLSLEAEGKSPRTRESYHYGPLRFADWLAELGRVDDVEQVTADDIRGHVAHVTQTISASTARTRFLGLRSFFGWCHQEQEIDADPTATVKQPNVKAGTVEVLRPEQMKALLDSCNTRSFVDLRDVAMMSFLADNGCRLSGLTSMTVEGTNIGERWAHIHTKASKELDVPFGAYTARALDRYLRARRKQAYAASEWFWLGSTGKGRLTSNGAYQIIRKRGERLGIKLHPHMFRHTFADAWLRSGGGEGDLMEIAGWESRQMLTRYARATRQERARLAHRDLSPMDRLK